MTDIITIPTHERPELLWVCLENLSRCNGIESKHVIISEDYHLDRPKPAALQSEILETIMFASKILPSVEHRQIRHTNYGCGYNFIEGWRRLFKSDAKYVYHIEDDTLVTQDYFKFCEAAHELCSDAFVVCGNARPQSRTSESSVVHLSDRWLQTYALSFRREQLGKILLPNYQDYKFTKNFEADTYVMNWMPEHNEYSVSPCQERAFTFGFYSYHIGGSPVSGSLTERVQHIKQALDNPAQLGGGYSTDFIRYQEPGPWSELRKRSSVGQRIKV